MTAFNCPRCGAPAPAAVSPLCPAVCPSCGQALSANAVAAAEPAALLLQCLGQALLKGAVTALGAALASAEAGATAGPEALPPGLQVTPSLSTGSAVDAVFAEAEAGLPEPTGLVAGAAPGRAEAVLRAGLMAALQELPNGGLVDRVRALRERQGQGPACPGQPDYSR